MIQQLNMKTQVENCKWILNLLECKFFGSCIDHQSMPKSEKNVFCMDCNLCFCRHCVSGFKPRCHHHHHRRLQICRYVYHDVVRLQDIQKHLDCYDIQTYKINGEKAVHLNPRPQQHKDSKPSKSKVYGTCCEACRRHIQDLPNRFCSIACKVSIMMGADINKQKSYKTVSYSFSKERYEFERHMNTNKLSFDSVEENIQRSTWLTSSLKAKRSVHKRKGVPQRAPLC